MLVMLCVLSCLTSFEGLLVIAAIQREVLNQICRSAECSLTCHQQIVPKKTSTQQTLKAKNVSQRLWANQLIMPSTHR